MAAHFPRTLAAAADSPSRLGACSRSMRTAQGTRRSRIGKTRHDKIDQHEIDSVTAFSRCVAIFAGAQQHSFSYLGPYGDRAVLLARTALKAEATTRARVWRMGFSLRGSRWLARQTRDAERTTYGAAAAHGRGPAPPRHAVEQTEPPTAARPRR